MREQISHSPLHFLTPLSFPRPEKERLSRRWRCPWCQEGAAPASSGPAWGRGGGPGAATGGAPGWHGSAQPTGRNYRLSQVRLGWSPPQALYEEEQQGLV